MFPKETKSRKFKLFANVQDSMMKTLPELLLRSLVGIRNNCFDGNHGMLSVSPSRRE